MTTTEKTEMESLDQILISDWHFIMYLWSLKRIKTNFRKRRQFIVEVEQTLESFLKHQVLFKRHKSLSFSKKGGFIRLVIKRWNQFDYSTEDIYYPDPFLPLYLLYTWNYVCVCYINVKYYLYVAALFSKNMWATCLTKSFLVSSLQKVRKKRRQ